MSFGQMRVDRILSSEDIDQLKNVEPINVSNQGQILAWLLEDETFILVDSIGNGFIPRDAMFASPYTTPLDIRGKALSRMEFIKRIYSSLIGTTMTGMGVPFGKTSFVLGRERKKLSSTLMELWDKHYVNHERKELSAELSQYLWSLDHDAIHVQFTSQVQPGLPGSQPKALFSHTGSGSASEFCLNACDDRTVKWLPRSNCGNGGHVWTVHLLPEPQPFAVEVHLCQRLRRRRAVDQQQPLWWKQ